MEADIFFLKIFMVIAFAFIVSIEFTLNSIRLRINDIETHLEDLRKIVMERTNINYIEKELSKKDGVTQSRNTGSQE